MGKSSKKLRLLFKSFKKEQILVCILIFIEIILSACIPFLIKDLVDIITYSNEFKEVIEISFFIVLITLVNVFIGVVQNYMWHRLRLNSINFLRGKMFEKALLKSKSYFDNNGIGKIIAIVIDDVSMVAQNIVIGFPMLFSNVFKFLVVVIVLFTFNIPLTIITLSVIPLYFLTFNYINKRIRKTSKLERERFELVVKDAQEKLQGVDTIKVFNKEEFMTLKFNQVLSNHFKFVKKNLLYNNIGMGVNKLIISLLPIAILLYGSSLVAKGSLTLGTLIAFFTYISTIYEPLSNLSDYTMGLQTSLSVGERILEFLEKDLNDNKGEYVKEFKSIRFENVSFGYNDKNLILENLNFEINKGDKVGFVGESGKGKTTVLKLILGLYKPVEGAIYINDININNINIKSLYSLISLQEQNLFIFDGTLKDNITLNSEISNDKVDKAIEVSQISELRKGIDISEIQIAESGANLSGGQKQRICLARALAKEFELIILDEPTSALDYNLEDKIKESLKRYIDDKTLIIISHRESMLDICDKIIDL